MEGIYNWFLKFWGDYFHQINYNVDLGVQLVEIMRDYQMGRSLLYGGIMLVLFMAAGSFNDSKRNPIRLVAYAGLIDGIGILVLHYLQAKLKWGGLGIQLDWSPHPANNMISLLLLILVIRSAYMGKPLRSVAFVGATYLAFPLMLRYLKLEYWKFYIFPMAIIAVGMIVVTQMKRFSLSWIVGYFFHLLARSSVWLMMLDYLKVDYYKFMTSYRADLWFFLAVLALALIYEHAVIGQRKRKTTTP